MSLQVLVNGFDIANGITHRINWVETTGLFDPVALVAPGAVDTFDGPFRVRQTTVDFGTREISISGILLVAASSYADKLRALDGLQAIYAARPSRVVVGTLELLVDFDRVQVAADQLKRLNGMIKYTVTGTAIPSTFSSSHGNGVGQIQGIPVDTQRVNEAAILATMASGVGTITNPGDVPTPAVLTIQNSGPTARVYYLATSATGRRVPIATDANGVGRLDERAGLYLVPGVNRITAYQAATGTATFTDITVMSFFGTTWRYSGNAAAATATRFDLGPSMTVNRPGSATYWTGTTIAYALNDEPRIGFVATGTGNGGLVVEGQMTNNCLQSENFGTTWVMPVGSSVTLNAAAAPDGAMTADRLTSTGSSPAAEQTITVAASTSYTFSCWVKAVTGTVSAVVEWENASTAVNYAQTTATVGTTWTRIYAIGSTPAGVTSVKVRVRESALLSIDVWGAQMEAGFAPSSYIPTTTGSVVRLPAVAGIGSPHNLALYSDTHTNAAWAFTGWSVAATPVAGPVASLLNAYQVTTTATSTDNIRQAVTIPGGLAGGKVYTFSVWLRLNATTASVVLHIENQAGTSRGQSGSGGNYSISLSSTWTRYWVTATMAAGDTDVILKIRTANAGGTIDVFGAQLTEGYLPGRYIRTTDTNVLPVSMIDPSWSQNGYIEADIVWPSRTTTTNLYHFGDGIATTAGTVIFTTNLSGTIIRFGRYDSGAVLRNAQIGNATVFNAGSARVRMEWTNYLLAGTRYMYLRLYLNGTLQVETNYASTAGPSWPIVDVTRFARLRSTSGDQGTISNLVIGTPSLPEGSQAAGI